MAPCPKLMPKRVRIYCRTAEAGELPDCPPGRKNQVSANQRRGSRTRKSRSSYAKSSALRDMRDRLSRNLVRKSVPDPRRGVPFSLGTRVTDLENNTKPQLPHSLSFPLSLSAEAASFWD